MTVVLGLDIGTTSTIGILVEATRPHIGDRYPTGHAFLPHAGWAREDPVEWWANVRAIVTELLNASGIEASEVKAVGVTGMLPAVVLLDGEGNVLRRASSRAMAAAGRRVAELPAGNGTSPIF